MEISPELKEQILSLIKAGRKIEAIKVIREEFSLPLQEAKLFAEQLEETIPPDQRTYPKVRSGSGSWVLKVFYYLGGLMMATALIWSWNTWSKLQKGVPVPGIVIDFEYNESETARPVITYTYEDYDFTITGDVGSSPPAYEIGEEVEIYVIDGDPRNYLIGSITELWLGSIIVGVIGLSFLLVGMSSRRFMK